MWDAENDVIKFKIDLKDQPMTRLGMLSVISSIYDPVGLFCNKKDFFKACDASRGLDTNKNISFSKWFKRPELLWHNEISWPAERTEAITDEDPEVKHLLIVKSIAENYGMLSYLTEIICGWKKLKKIVAILIQCKQKLLKFIRQIRQYHNIEYHTSEESYQYISML